MHARHTIHVAVALLITFVAACPRDAEAQLPIKPAIQPAAQKTGKPVRQFAPRHLRTNWSTPPAPAQTNEAALPAVAQVAFEQEEPIVDPPSVIGQGVPLTIEPQPVDEEFVIDPGPMFEPGQGECQECLDSQGWGPEVLPGIWVDHLSIFGGVNGLKGPANRGQGGSFGPNVGFNYGTAAKNIILPPTFGWQIGFQTIQTDLEGTSFSTEQRQQYFLTTGVFRKGDGGLQGGLAVDYLRDRWYFDVEATQLRGELSVAISNLRSYGFWFTTSLDDSTSVSRLFGDDAVETWETIDIYALFYRTSLFGGGRGEAMIFGGATEGSNGIMGAQSSMPLHNGWALETEFTYLIPDEGRGRGGNEHEAWNLGINLAWYPGSLACGSCYRYHRPLFKVANNGSMILRQKN